MREVVLDTETTGLNSDIGDRIVEIGCVELVNHVATGEKFHQYVNPERSMPDEAWTQVLPASEKVMHTIRQYEECAEKWEPCERCDQLSWFHHWILRDREDRHDWIKLCLEDGIEEYEIRKLIRKEKKKETPAAVPDAPVALHEQQPQKKDMRAATPERATAVTPPLAFFPSGRGPTGRRFPQSTARSYRVRARASRALRIRAIRFGRYGICRAACF